MQLDFVCDALLYQRGQRMLPLAGDDISRPVLEGPGTHDPVCSSVERDDTHMAKE